VGDLTTQFMVVYHFRLDVCQDAHVQNHNMSFAKILKKQ